MPRFNEKSAVEDYIVEKLEEMNWKFIKADCLERESYSEPLLEKNLRKAIEKLNPDIGLTENDMNRILVELKSRSAGMEGVKQILRFLKYGVPTKLEKSRDLRFISLIDYEETENNEFLVSRQVYYESANEKIRVDLILYVNGIPLVEIECKNPADPTTSWEDAYKQVKDYEKKVPELYKYVQFGIAAEEAAKYFPNVSWLEEVTIYTWRKEEFDELEATLEMLDQKILLDIVRNFLFMREEKGKTTKVITRYMQYRAANKIYKRVINNLRGKEDKKSGLIWHWQGSGKTLIMIFAANKIYREKLLENPSIFFIVDRRELEKQLYEEFGYLDIDTKPEKISSVKELKEVLAYDSGKGKRGNMITLIHKFRPEEFEGLQKELEEMKESETIIERKDVIAFIDEGHRTQYGILAAQMREILKNAFFIAFTGTPIAKTGRDTFQEFSYVKEGESYLDKYFIKESIEDGFTVPIAFQTRLEKEVHLQKDLLEYFLKQEEEEIPEEIRENVKEETRKKLDEIKVRLKNPKRIDLCAKDMAEHFRENIDGKFKGLVVAVDREACIDYKRALDKYLPNEYSEIVMTFNVGDKEKITEYRKEMENRYGKNDIEKIIEEIQDKFKEEEYPKILIVTEMLLTGFDAPILQTMYLNKPLKEHRLLQAIARTNRPYRDLKEAGLILDYVGIFKEFEKALAIYSKDDIKDVAYNITEEEKEFRITLENLEKIFNGVEKGYEREILMKAVRIVIEDEANSEIFQNGYKKLRKIFEFLGPHPLKLEFLERFNWLTAVYIAYNRHVKRVDPEEMEKYIQKFLSRTINIIYKTIEIGKIKKNFPILLLDDKYLERLSETYPDLEGRISDMIFTINKFILVDKSGDPIYESIIEKVERIVKKWKEKKEGAVTIYDELKGVIGEANEIEARQKELSLSREEYAMLIIFEKNLGKSDSLLNDVKIISKDIKKVIFKGWSLKRSAEREIGLIIRKYLRKYKISIKERDELYDKIINTLKKYD